MNTPGIGLTTYSIDETLRAMGDSYIQLGLLQETVPRRFLRARLPCDAFRDVRGKPTSGMALADQ